MNKENYELTPTKRSRSPSRSVTPNNKRSKKSKLQNISNLINSAPIWSPLKKRKSELFEVEPILETVKDETFIHIFSDKTTQKKIIELDRPVDDEQCVETLKYEIVQDKDGLFSIEKLSSKRINKVDPKQILNVKVLENSFNNVIYYKLLNQNVPKEKICKNIVESFTYKQDDVVRRVSILESAGSYSLQEYIFVQVVDMLDLKDIEREKINEYKNTFMKLIVSMIKNKRANKRRNMKGFAEFFPKQTKLYDSVVDTLEKNLEECFSNDMRNIIERLLEITHLLNDMNIVHNDTVYQNVFIKKSKRGDLKCRLIDFDISASYSPEDSTLYVPKLCFFEEGKRVQIKDHEIKDIYNYFVNKSNDVFEDIEYFCPRYEGEGVDFENMLVYLASTKENQKFYDKIWEIAHSKESHQKRWAEIDKLLKK